MGLKNWTMWVDPNKNRPQHSAAQANIQVQFKAPNNYSARAQMEAVYGRDANLTPIVPDKK